jgi:hypothetical protein
MLTDHKTFEGTLVSAWDEPTYRRRDCLPTHTSDGTRYEAQRHRFIVDEQDAVLGVVSDRYKLVQNRDLVAALDLAASEVGVNVEPVKVWYSNGRSGYDFRCPDYVLRPRGDTSNTTGLIRLTNDYRGQGGVGFLSGWFRLVCTNGLVVGEIAHRQLYRHTGDIQELVYETMVANVRAFRDNFEVQRVIAETLGNADLPPVSPQRWANLGDQTAARNEVRDNPDTDLVNKLLADTAERYHQDLARAIRDNVSSIGRTYWALAQAVAEVATHRLQRRQNGAPRARYNPSADEWATRQLNRILEEVGA